MIIPQHFSIRSCGVILITHVIHPHHQHDHKASLTDESREGKQGRKAEKESREGKQRRKAGEKAGEKSKLITTVFSIFLHIRASRLDLELTLNVHTNHIKHALS